jgi:hypothetical protein
VIGKQTASRQDRQRDLPCSRQAIQLQFDPMWTVYKVSGSRSERVKRATLENPL